MNHKTLKPMPAPPFTSGAVAQEMGRLGGKVKSPLKTLAARIRELKKKGVNDEVARHLHELITSREALDTDIALAIECMKSQARTVGDAEKIVKLMIEFRKVRFGNVVCMESDSSGVQLTAEDFVQGVLRRLEENKKG